jgi:hypothetical protein
MKTADINIHRQERRQRERRMFTWHMKTNGVHTFDCHWARCLYRQNKRWDKLIFIRFSFFWLFHRCLSVWTWKKTIFKDLIDRWQYSFRLFLLNIAINTKLLEVIGEHKNDEFECVRYFLHNIHLFVFFFLYRIRSQQKQDMIWHFKSVRFELIETRRRCFVHTSM